MLTLVLKQRPLGNSEMAYYYNRFFHAVPADTVLIDDRNSKSILGLLTIQRVQ